MLGFAIETTTDKSDPVAEFKEGAKLLKNNYPQKALVKLQSAFDSDAKNPCYMSFLGVAIARATKNWAQGTELCEKAVQLSPKEIQFHLNLAEVHALAGHRDVALYKLDCAIASLGDDPRLKRARSKLEKRRAPVLPFFGRGHFLNRELGKLRHRLLQRFDR